MAHSVHLEKVSDIGINTNTAWVWKDETDLLTHKVGELLTKTWGAAWTEHRLAYGVQIKSEKPTGLLWIPREIGPEYDPTIQELFENTWLQGEETYYILITKLNPNNRDDERFRRDVERAQYRFHDLYSGRPRVTGGGWRPP